MPATETPSRSVTADSQNHTAARSAPAPRRRRNLFIALVLAAVAAVAVVVVLLVSSDDKSDRLVLGQPREVSAAQLSSYAKAAKRPVYWAGAAANGFKLELT